MKYLSYIFEDQDVRNQVEQYEVLVEMAAKAVIKHNILLESYIYNNMEQFTSSVDLNETYSSIRDFVISENTSLYSQISEVLADSQLSLEEKAYCLETDTPPVEHVEPSATPPDKTEYLLDKARKYAKDHPDHMLGISGVLGAGVLGYGTHKLLNRRERRD